LGKKFIFATKPLKMGWFWGRPTKGPVLPFEKKTNPKTPRPTAKDRKKKKEKKKFPNRPQTNDIQGARTKKQDQTKKKEKKKSQKKTTEGKKNIGLGRPGSWCWENPKIGRKHTAKFRERANPGALAGPKRKQIKLRRTGKNRGFFSKVRAREKKKKENETSPPPRHKQKRLPLKLAGVKTRDHPQPSKKNIPGGTNRYPFLQTPEKPEKREPGWGGKGGSFPTHRVKIVQTPPKGTKRLGSKRQSFKNPLPGKPDGPRPNREGKTPEFLGKKRKGQKGCPPKNPGQQFTMDEGSKGFPHRTGSPVPFISKNH